MEKPECFDKWLGGSWAEDRKCNKCDFFVDCKPLRQTPQEFATGKALGLAAGKTQIGGTHYKDMEVQPWDVIDTWPKEQRIGYHRGNALKYIMRMGSKDEQLQEIRKAKHYIEKLIEELNDA
jgi:hypothetical protein